jgi:hypothetical protein
MRNFSPVLLVSCVTLASLSLASSIVVSDGPSETTASESKTNPSKIVTTDGPPEWKAAAQSGVHLYGRWVVESEGPGTARIVGAPASHDASSAASEKVVIIDGPEPVRPPKHTVKIVHAKKIAPLPEAETSTLAPIIPTKTQTPWKTLALILAFFASILFGTLVWTIQKR